MKKYVSIISALVCLMLVAALAACGKGGALPGESTGASNQTSDSKHLDDPSVIKGTYLYEPSFEPLTEETFYYSDEYFSKSGKEDDVHRMSMSYAIAMSICEEQDCKSAIKLLKDTGYDDLQIDDIYEKPGRDTMGTIIAHKKVGDHNMIVVVLRGNKYGSEWASNFTIGKTGDSKGFSDARDLVVQRLTDYINKYSLTNNKIWSAGYSRGGAVANLLGVTINRDPAKFYTTEDDLFIYAFEPAAGCVDDTIYENINVVVNPGDPVTFVCPRGWGFHLNGKVTVLCEDKPAMSYTDLLNPTEYKELTEKTIMNDFMDWFAGRVSREQYVEEFEEPFTTILDVLYRYSDEEIATLGDDVSNVSSILQKDYKKSSRLMSLIRSAVEHRSDYICDQITDLIVEAMDESRKNKSPCLLTDDEYETIKTNLYPVMRTLIPLYVDDMYYYEGIDYDSFYTENVPAYHLSDRDYGLRKGREAGEEKGYEAGFEKHEYDDAPIDVDELLGREYVSGYKKGYKETYRQAYNLGASHADDLIAKGSYDGKKQGEEDGFLAGQYDLKSTPEGADLTEEKWMTEQYKAAYHKAYEAAYVSKYEEGSRNKASEAPLPDIIDAYHVTSFVKDFSDLVRNHFSKVNYDYIKSMDSYYQ